MRTIREVVLLMFHVLASLALTVAQPPMAPDPTQGGNLLVNPSFEELPNAHGLIPPWIIEEGGATRIPEGFRVARIKSFVLPAQPGEFWRHGKQFVELNQTTIAQDVITVPGQLYRIQISLANADGLTSAVISVQIDDVTLGTATRVLTSWGAQFAEFVATRVQHRIRFKGEGSAGGVPIGDYLDNVIMVPIDETQSTLGYTYYLPQFAAGGAWTTDISGVGMGNLGATHSSTQYSIQGFDPDGGQLFDTISGSIPRSGSFSIPITGFNTLQTGWVMVRSGNPLNVSVIYRESVPGRLDFEAAVLAREPTHEIFAPFDNTGGFSTAFAIGNPTPSNLGPGAPTICLTITAYDQEGSVIATVDQTYGPLNQSAVFLAQILPATQGEKGSVRIVATYCSLPGSPNLGPATFVPLGLRFSPGGAFTTLPW